MSLFGDDPPSSITPTRRPKASASLFADADDADASGPASAAATAGSAAVTASSPLSSWTPVPSAKRASMRGAALLRSLVPPGQAPDTYVDAYDRMAAENRSGGGGGVDAATVRDVLAQSGVDADAAVLIRKTVMPDESRELGRAEVNVFLAMIGLAQEGEEVTLDGVDERRRSESSAGCHRFITDHLWKTCRPLLLARIALKRLPTLLPKQNFEGLHSLTKTMLKCRTAEAHRILVARIRDVLLLGSHMGIRIRIRGQPLKSIRGIITQLPTAPEYQAHRPSLCLKGPLAASRRRLTLAPVQESQHQQGTQSVAIPPGVDTIQGLVNLFAIPVLEGLENRPAATERVGTIQQLAALPL
jgi:hypothetical protein